MTNADKFKAVFGIYSEEFWAKPEQDMLSWINSEYQEHKTNADRIRSMTDEELAEFINMVWGNGRAALHPHNGWHDWLKEEVKDERNKNKD